MKFSTSMFRYHKARDTFYASRAELGVNTYPREVTLVSARTNKELVFVQDNEAAERNEYWDGTMYEYKSSDDAYNHIRIVITE